MKTAYSFVFVAVMALLVACSSSKSLTPQPSASDIPEWYTNVPEDPNYLFTASTATSRDLDLATRKAAQNARSAIGQQLEVKLEGLVKSFTEEVGEGEDSEYLTQFTDVNKSVTSQVLNGTKVVKQKILKDGNVYRSYVLMQMPIGAANEQFMNQLKQRQNLYTRYRATQAFNDLEREVEKYETFKKEQSKEMDQFHQEQPQ